MLRLHTTYRVSAVFSTLALVACTPSHDDDEPGSESTETTSNEQETDTPSTSGSGSTTSGSTGGTTVDCDNISTEIEEVVCAVDEFLATLDDTESAAVAYEMSDTTARTTWTNLPGGLNTRNGLRFGDLSETSVDAAINIARLVLSDDGYTDLLGVIAADGYLGLQGGGGGPGGGDIYSSDNYYIAVFGTPSVDADWMLQIGGHHMAYNITYAAGVGFPVPHHLGVEPKGEFTVSGETYSPMAVEGQIMLDAFSSLDTDQLQTAYLSDEAYMDVLVGPDNGSGVLPSNYPAGDNRRGLLVSTLTASQQESMFAAIQQWVGDYHSDISTRLLEEYTTTEALSDTYIAWAGDASGPDLDVSGTYFRIDGPRLWIELACQGGVVIQGQTHYHSIYRDKTMDYGGSL